MKNQLTYQETTLEVCDGSGLLTSHAGYVAVGSGLGYWSHSHESETLYNVTHLASGYHVGDRAFAAEDQARAFIEQAALLADWTRTREAIAADPATPGVWQQLQETARKVAWSTDMQEFAAEMREVLPELTDEEIERMAEHW